MKFLAVEGRIGDAIKQIDWDAHPLGPARQWSPALKSSIYTLLNSASPKVLLWGAQLITFFNDACSALVQERGVRGLGLPYPDFRPGLWPRLRGSIEAAMRGEGSIVQEFRTLREHEGATSTGVYQLCFSPVLDENGNIAGVLIDIFDVTAQKAMEENLLGEVTLLNGLFSTTPVLIAYAAAPDLRFEYVNAAFSRLVGDRPMVGRLVSEAVPEADEQGFIEILRGVLASGEPWGGREVPVALRPKEGGEPVQFYLDFVYQPMQSPDGAISGILFSGYDVSDRRKARDESERLRHALLHSSQQAAMGTMAQTIAHELNQPLTAAANFLSTAEFFLERREGSELELHSLGKAREQMLRAGSIVRRMRSLVKCGEARSSEFDLERSIARVIDLVRASGDLDRLGVDVTIAPEARLAMGDHVQIEQVLVNLLRNAAQASAGDEARAAVSAIRQGSMIEVSLRDWGPGLPAERLTDLFAPAEEPSQGEGLGVGLSLCRTIVEAHGGRISGCNCPDGGALFRFTLRAAEGQSAD